ncbi:MAG: Na(+)-translocating NADH-quinone reductase subunit C [Nitrosomonas sp.]|nr:Na(+)-translocating NADH-quinone reductase subunit C [Nitrosomonas sp.]MCC7136207.1 Na(+)-translocating NADH-quinone reductase subunit C [Nitrosomonas sp.]
MAESKPAPVQASSNRQILGIALVVCLVCSLVVATTAVTLKPLQTANQIEARQQVLVELAGLTLPDGSIEAAYRRFDVVMVELDSGEPRPDISAENFDLKLAVRREGGSTPLARADDPANIRRRPIYLPVYQLRNRNGYLETLILPVFGYGLWSTLYGFIALKGDLRTITGIRFYEHGETPGLGGEVDNPDWLASWRGKVAFDENWQPRIELVKGHMSGDDVLDHQYKVDGLSGATMTTRGINDLLKYWLGDTGFGPYLMRLRKQQDEGVNDETS